MPDTPPSDSPPVNSAAAATEVASTKPPLEPKDRFPVDYKKRDDDIRHYSTTRSALTSFLMTVGLTLLAYYFNTSYPHRLWFFPAVGILVLGAALFVCGVFSFRTERSWLHQKDLWKWSKGELTNYPEFKDPTGNVKKLIWKGMWNDWMNRALLVVVVLIILLFCGSVWWVNCHDQLSNGADADIAKSAQNSSQAAAEAVKLAEIASTSALDASRRATESEKSAKAAAEAARASADRIAKPPRSSAPGVSLVGGEDMAVVQRDLVLAGFDPGPIDGKDGRRTKKAAKELCGQAGIQFKGYQDPAFLDALNSRLRNPQPR